MTVGLVWAQAHDRVIGAGNAIPWHIPEDLRHFKDVTGSARVVMGRRTWDSLPERFRPLPGRENVVLTRSSSWSADGAVVVPDLDTALEHDGDVWVMGGGEIYELAIARAEVLEVTEVDLDVDGDSRAPVVGPEWVLASTDPYDGWHESATSGVRFRWLTYHRA